MRSAPHEPIPIEPFAAQLQPQPEPQMQSKSLNVHVVPQEVAETALARRTVVAIDLLRASTTICAALASGALEVVPFLEIDDALIAAAKEDRSRIVLGGERGGKRIEGFDLGNSPSEYTPERVHGKRVFLTTTNGTRALSHARLAGRTIVGAFANLSAVVASIKDEPHVDVLCAGTDGRETREDILAAGAMVHQLLADDSESWQLNAAAKSAQAEWQSVLQSASALGRTPSAQLAIEFRTAPGGVNLLAICMEADLIDCAQIDTLTVVPMLDLSTWRISLP